MRLSDLVIHPNTFELYCCRLHWLTYINKIMRIRSNSLSGITERGNKCLNGTECDLVESQNSLTLSGTGSSVWLHSFRNVMFIIMTDDTKNSKESKSCYIFACSDKMVRFVNVSIGVEAITNYLPSINGIEWKSNLWKYLRRQKSQLTGFFAVSEP